jgi:hypothetical protein
MGVVPCFHRDDERHDRGYLAFAMDAVLQRHDKDGKVIPAKSGIYCAKGTLYTLFGIVSFIELLSKYL